MEYMYVIMRTVHVHWKSEEAILLKILKLLLRRTIMAKLIAFEVSFLLWTLQQGNQCNESDEVISNTIE